LGKNPLQKKKGWWSGSRLGPEFKSQYQKERKKPFPSVILQRNFKDLFLSPSGWFSLADLIRELPKRKTFWL
jgi:hypothetical protein